MIILKTNVIAFSRDLLGTETAWLWVGTSYSPLDNDNERVQKTRALMEQYYPYVPYGMWVGNREENRMVPLKDMGDDYYVADISWWPVGAYRMNLHTGKGESSPYGSELHPENRDQDCSWSPLEKPEWNDALRSFLHTEENGAGCSLRILIRPNRNIEPFGDES